MIDVRRLVLETVRKVVRIARKTLMEQGSHIPTAILHTPTGTFPIVIPFKDQVQKRALIEFVNTQAVKQHAFAVTTVTCARVVDSRTRKEEESLVVTTAIQGGRPHFVVQPFARDSHGCIISFGNTEEGEEAAMPGQMMIVPPWDEETQH